ncbi:hypothetical protein ES703_35555 [subsurface metagenome]
MATKIEWCEESWNPITGCSPVSEGCEHCYARRIAQRLKGRYGYPQDDPFKVTFHPERLDQPLKWKKPRHIFVVSMGDLFHEDVRFKSIFSIWGIMAKAHWHTFLILTKRPAIMKDRLRWIRHFGRLPNIYLGVTAENQDRLDERVSILLQIPATKHFVSIEPMLGPVDSMRYFSDPHYGTPPDGFNQGLDWIIVGGESGPGARPMHPDWPRSVRDQCQEATVPFFFKQWGEWRPHKGRFGGGIFIKPDGTFTCQGDSWDGSAAAMNRVGKKQAGRLLEGREYNERP